MTLPSLWSLLHTPAAELLGWTLLHFVWQGALVAAVLAGALRLLRTHSPRVRYAVSGAALLGLLALPIGTAGILSGDMPSVASSAASESLPVVSASEAGPQMGADAAVGVRAASPSWRARVAGTVQPALPWVVGLWGLGVIGFAVRLGGGAWRVRRLRRRSSAASSRWRDRLGRLADQMGVGETVELRRSERVDGPMLAGWWRPVILVPAGFLSGFPPQQVEALLLHELAHVRRHDVLVGRLQAMVETLLFFHPATWWISGQVRQAREACCDDLAVEAGSGRRVYAEALTALAEQALDGRSTMWAPAASDGSLLDRIQRLVIPEETTSASTAGRRLSIGVAAVLMIVVPVVLAACASQQSATMEPTTDEAAEAPEAPPNDAEQQVIVTTRDSTERRVVIEADRPDEADSLEARIEENVFVVQSRDRVDTIEVSGPTPLHGGVHPPFPPDSLERVILDRINPDSIERMARARIKRINPDSIERVVRRRFNADSLERHIARMERRADSIAQRHTERFSDEHVERWMFRKGPDSTGAFDFDREEFDVDFDGDLDVDSLLRHHEHRADSLRRHFDRMRKQMEENRSEHLREQARRLRERAERLEEQAEEMERRSAPSADTLGGELGAVTEPRPKSTPRIVLEDFRTRVDGHRIADGAPMYASRILRAEGDEKPPQVGIAGRFADINARFSRGQ